MNEIIIFFALFVVTLIGFVFLRVIKLLDQYSLFESLPYCFGIGVGLVSFQLFLYSFFSIKWGIDTIFSPWILLGLCVWFKNNESFFKLNRIGVHYTFLEKLISILIVMLLLLVLFESTLSPLSAWDGWAIWVIKAKMFYLDGFVNPTSYHLLSENYPYVINLSLVFILKILGHFDDKSILLFFYSFYFFITISIFTTLKRYSSNLIALLFTFLLISTQNILRHGGRFEAGYADLALGFYILLSGIIFLQFLKSNTYKDLILLEIILVIGSLVKEEGLVFGLICNAILFSLVCKKRNYGYLYVFLIFIIPQFLWQIFKVKNGLYYSLYAPLTLIFQRFFAIWIEIGREFMNLKNWNILWLAFFISIPLSIKTLARDKLIILLLIVTQLFSYSIIFMISPHLPSQHIPNTMNRLLLHIAPLSTFYVGLVFSSLTRSRPKNKRNIF